MGEAQEKRPLLPEWALATAAREIGGLTAAATLLQHGGAGCALLRPDSAGLLPGKGEGIIGQNKAPGAMLQALLHCVKKLQFLYGISAPTIDTYVSLW